MLNKPTIFGYPPLWKPPYDNIPRTSPLCRANFHQVGRPLSTRGGKSNVSGAGLPALGCQLCEWSKGSSKWYRNRYAMLDTPTNVYANLYMMFPMYIYISHMYANVYAKLYCIHTHMYIHKFHTNHKGWVLRIGESGWKIPVDPVGTHEISACGVRANRRYASLQKGMSDMSERIYGKKYGKTVSRISRCIVYQIWLCTHHKNKTMKRINQGSPK